MELDVPGATSKGMRTVVASNQNISWPMKHGDSQESNAHSDDVSLAIRF